MKRKHIKRIFIKHGDKICNETAEYIDTIIFDDIEQYYCLNCSSFCDINHFKNYNNLFAHNHFIKMEASEFNIHYKTENIFDRLILKQEKISPFFEFVLNLFNRPINTKYDRVIKYFCGGLIDDLNFPVEETDLKKLRSYINSSEYLSIISFIYKTTNREDIKFDIRLLSEEILSNIYEIERDIEEVFDIEYETIYEDIRKRNRKPRTRRNISLRDRILTFERDNYTCQICKRNNTMEGVLLHVDHKIAVANGGKDELSNYWTLCQDCNLGKGALVLNLNENSLKPPLELAISI